MVTVFRFFFWLCGFANNGACTCPQQEITDEDLVELVTRTRLYVAGHRNADKINGRQVTITAKVEKSRNAPGGLTREEVKFILLQWQTVAGF